MLRVQTSVHYDTFYALSEIIKALKPLRDNGILNDARANALLGRYLDSIPKSRSIDNWTGYMSKKAIEEYLTNDNPNINCEHAYPKRIIIPQLFDKYYEQATNPTEFEVLYFTLFGKFNLVTREENETLKEFQKPDTFISPKASYKSAGIDMVDTGSGKNMLFNKKGAWWKNPIKENIELLNNK